MAKRISRKPSQPQTAKARRAAAAPRATPGAELSLRAIGAKEVNTIVHVHGIGNKPTGSILKCQWDTALFGTQLGDRSRMAYWVNRDYYPEPLPETCASGDRIALDDEEASTKAIQGIMGETGSGERALRNEIAALAGKDRRRAAVLSSLAARLAAAPLASETPPAAGPAARDLRAKVIPLPGFLRRLITRSLTRVLLRDVNDFLFMPERREAMEQSFVDRLAGNGPFVVVAHSQGSMIAYNVLRRMKRSQLQVPLFLTIGSPLGLEEVQDEIKRWTGGKLPFPDCVDRWVNIADRLDPVALDNQIANDFAGAIEDIRVTNPDSPRHPHSATGYLGTAAARTAVREAVGNSFQQAIAPFTIAKDLVGDLENGDRDARHEVLIQLVATGQAGAEPPRLDRIAQQIEDRIRAVMQAGKADPDAAGIERLRHFVVAQLTRQELEALRAQHEELKINGIWRNAAKRALILDSTNTVQAHPANLGYGANGRRIAWAILDTGIRADHPHFALHKNVVEQWDCTGVGAAVRHGRGQGKYATLDGHGHGTHVAGIVAGEMTLKNRNAEDVTLAGMAPHCQLYGFKVLADDGNGKDSWIIKALDKVAEINENAGQLVIHGVNLSLGGGFDPSVFGCGHTPLCGELRRLWRQGVVVCLAAGNEGYAVLASAGGDIQANLDLSIGDPANLDEAIAVGSVHKTNPHTYGVSYFSSRGPTADGRRKPDVVAPGEQIISARHDWKTAAAANASPLDEHFVQMSGTSMATPHVSGVLAAFLSLRREFIGYPDRVKKMLLDGCVDLNRDPYMQGAGLPNLIKMLALN